MTTKGRRGSVTEDMLSSNELAVRLAVAERAARAAGRLLLEHSGKVAVEHKTGPADLVTAADRAAEALIIDILQRAFPEDGIVGEESGLAGGAGRHRWIVDPLDGTTNYAQGVPFYATSIGLERDGNLLVGVVHAPATGVTYSAVRGEGAWRNGERLAVSKTERLVDSLLATDVAPDLDAGGGRGTMRLLETLAEKTRGLRIFGSAALHLAFVAEGTLEGYWQPDVQAWDVAAGVLLVEEAGGLVTDMTGGPLDLFRPRVLATNGLVHPAMVASLVRTMEQF